MTVPFVQSHSSMECFRTCPRQYEAKYITKEVVFKENEAARWGNEVHAALEKALESRDLNLPPHMPYQAVAAWVLRRASRPGAMLLVEDQFGVRRDMTACAYFDKSGWIRAKIDVTVIYADGTADVFDWKTGKVKQDRRQLLLYALMVFAKYPQVHTVRTGYVWLGQPREEMVPEPVVYTRVEIPQLRKAFDETYDLIASAYSLGVFVPTPNGLCKKWCEVTSCEFHGRGRSW